MSGPWQPSGPDSAGSPVSARQAELRQQAIELLVATEELAEADLRLDSAEVTSLRALDGHLAIRSGLLRDRLRAGAASSEAGALHEVSTALARVQTLRFEIRDFLVHERLRRLEALDEGLNRLRAVHDPDLLLHDVCRAVVECCGFERVMLSRVEGSMWRPWRSYGVGVRESETHFRDWISGIPQISLDTLLLEGEMVRRREAAIVADARSDPRVSPVLREAAGHQSYVAAPLMPEDKVVGFLHADYREAPVSPLDRDVLAAFARAFDQIFERAALLRRLEEQRERMRATIESVGEMLDGLASAEIELVRRETSSTLSVTRDTRSARPAAGEGLERLKSLLTPRELEVLSLLATGATNDRIAERLVISSDTVKSHVKHILRKLRADNRAAAIAHYLRITLERGEG